MPTLTGLPALYKRAQVLATSALSWLTAIAAVLAVVAQQLNTIAGVPQSVCRAVASAIAVLGAIILQVRRVTPVADADKGLLPPKGPAVEAVPNDPDRGDIGLSMVFRLLALACFIVVAVIGFDVITSVYVFGWLGVGLAAWILSTFVQ